MTTVSPGAMPLEITLSPAISRSTVTGRASTVLSGLTTKMKLPLLPHLHRLRRDDDGVRVRGEGQDHVDVLAGPEPAVGVLERALQHDTAGGRIHLVIHEGQDAAAPGGPPRPGSTAWTASAPAALSSLMVDRYFAGTEKFT